MNYRSLLKLLTSILCLALASATVNVTEAWAQGGGATISKKKKKADRSLQKAAARSAADLAKRLDKKKKGQPSDLKKGPGVDRKKVADAKNTRSPEELQKIRDQIRAKNASLIAKLDTIIQGAPHSPSKPDWMFQKAELMWEVSNQDYLAARATFNKCLEAVDKGNKKEGECKEPQPNYSKPEAIYKQILQQAPSYERLDEVIYRLGRGLIEAGKGAQAVQYLNRLVTNYPNSPYKSEAHLALGEFYFGKNIFGLARTNYMKTLEDKEYDFYDYALYKLAWVHYNEGEYEKSVTTFQNVVERSNKAIGFQKQAINDLIVAFSEVKNGWKRARAYFLKKRDKEFTYKKMGQMAGYLEGQGKDDDAVSIYEWFLKERPDHKKVPQWMESIIIAKKKDVNNIPATEKTMNRFIAYLDPAGTWYTKNKANKGAIKNADLLTEASLVFLATHHETAAEKAKEAGKPEAKGSFANAAKYYKKFIDRFPEKPQSFSMGFILGQLYLYELARLEDSAKEFQKVVDLYRAKKIPKGLKKDVVNKIVKDSAFEVVSAYNELVKTNHKDSLLTKMAEAAETGAKVKASSDKKGPKDTKPIPRQKLLKYEEGFVKASDQWSELYPKDDRTPTVDYISAEVYKSRGQYDRCVPRYESIIQNAPKHRYARFAGVSLLDANYRLKRWDHVEKWARYMLDKKIYTKGIVTKDSLRDTIAFAINEDAKNLMKAKKTEKAALRLIKLADEFPKSKLAPGALKNAGAIYERGDHINKAIATYERVVKNYAGTNEASESLYVMGAIYETRADFDRAAQYYERLADPAYAGKPEVTKAIYDAARVREALEQWDKAIKIYEKYKKLFPKEENAKKLGLKLAFLELEKKNLKGAEKRFNKYLKDKNKTKGEEIAVLVELGLIKEKLKKRKWEKESAALFEKAIKKWDALAKSEDAEDKKQAKSSSRAVAHARFRQAERMYQQALNVKFQFPMSRLIKSLQAKAKLQGQAQELYFSVIQMKNPFWSSAAAYRIGQMYRDYADQLTNLPLPKGLTEDQEDEYRGALDEKILPLEEKASGAFRRALAISTELKAYNEWSAKSAKALSKLDEATYPITKEPGVVSDHSQVQFTRTTALTDLNVVKTRMGKREQIRLEEERKRREEEERKRREEAERKRLEAQKKQGK